MGPELIILRVALGRAWSKETAINISKIVLREMPTDLEQDPSPQCDDGSRIRYPTQVYQRPLGYQSLPRDPDRF